MDEPSSNIRGDVVLKTLSNTVPFSLTASHPVDAGWVAADNEEGNLGVTTGGNHHRPVVEIQKRP